MCIFEYSISLLNNNLIKFSDENLSIMQNSYNNLKVINFIESIKNISSEEIYKHLSEIEKNFAGIINNVVICGIGGSSLGIRTFVKQTIIANSIKRNCIFLENIDPASILKSFKTMKLSDSLFIFISKSGYTIETLSQVEYVLSVLFKNNLDISKHCISITSIGTNSDLENLSLKNNIKIYPWSNNIGGRFSAFTISTLLPLSLLGINIEKIIKAAKECIVNENSYDFNNYLKIKNNLDLLSMPKLAFIGASANYLLWKLGYDVNVLMPYADQMSDMVLWYRQLWCESVGKNEFGSIVDPAIGTIDQHSTLQMYLGGKKNKFFTLIKIDSTGTEFENEESQKLFINTQYITTLNKKGSINFAQILKAGCESTFVTFIENKCPVRMITIPFVDEYYITKIMVYFCFETIFVVELANELLKYKINAFDQPNVELSKTNFINAINIDFS